MKKYQHYFLDYSSVCCLACGLNSRYIKSEIFCSKNTNKYKWDRQFISGRKLIENDNAREHPELLPPPLGDK